MKHILTAIALILVMLWSWFLGIRFVFSASYTVTLNTAAVTEAQVRGWLNDAGYQELTGLAQVTVNDGGATHSSVGGACNDGVCFAHSGAIQFSAQALLDHPWFSAGWEYGHVWNNYFRWTYNGGGWDSYLLRRGISPSDPRLDPIGTSCWNPQELSASDYYFLFARQETTPGVVVARFASQCGLLEPENIVGFRDWFALTWTQSHPPPGYGSTPATPTPQPATATSTRTPVATPTMGPVTPTLVVTCTPPRARRCR